MRCAGVLVRARNSTVRGGRHFSSGSAHGQVSRYTAVVARVADCVEFYTEALKLRVQRNVPDKLLILGDGARNSCDVGLSQVPTSSPANASTEPKLRYPYLTFGVSNLKTAARHAKRKQGNVVGEVLPASPGASAEATFIDPAGLGMRVLHLFRRNPCISVTLGVTDVDASANLYQSLFGMRAITGPELLELHLPAVQSTPDTRIALGFGAAHNTTSLVLERVGYSGAEICSNADDAPVFTIAVPDLQAAYSKVTAAQLPATPFDSSKHKSFTCIDKDGYTLHVTQAVAAVPDAT